MISWRNRRLARDRKSSAARVAAEGQRINSTDRFHARQRAEFCEKLIVESQLLIWFRISRRAQNEVGRHHVRWVKARISGAEVYETAHEQSRSRQQQKRDCELRDNEQSAQASGTLSAAGTF